MASLRDATLTAAGRFEGYGLAQLLADNQPDKPNETGTGDCQCLCCPHD